MVSNPRYEPMHLSPTELRIYNLLSDGKPHSRDEIFDKCIENEMTDKQIVRITIFKLREKLPVGLTIESRRVHRKWYWTMNSVSNNGNKR